MRSRYDLTAQDGDRTDGIDGIDCTLHWPPKYLVLIPLVLSTSTNCCGAKDIFSRTRTQKISIIFIPTFSKLVQFLVEWSVVLTLRVLGTKHCGTWYWPFGLWYLLPVTILIALWMMINRYF